MSIFDNIFGKNDSKGTSSQSVMWNELTQLQQLDTIAEESESTPVLIFKHSTRCSVSRMALRGFENEYSLPEEDLKLYFLDLIAYRNVSNEIASRFDVVHQSPQVILIKNGKAVYNESHSDIDVTAIEDIL
ncbi:thioredoxin family protein [Flavobacterium suaedae]|uniref:Thioredoxin family protein n=1 Tax=Flavobacterium suaedae TaxID=1767027 RepID=A0ABQ1JGA7_9FLAO|nr:bacillithiol system redox-active protein YtxJ [Flavobacterium suaedae]GGB68251.1 thioredoxin family protein [Flavobacterium suaedae]